MYCITIIVYINLGAHSLDQINVKEVRNQELQKEERRIIIHCQNRMASTNSFRVISCLLALIMTLQYLVPSAHSRSSQTCNEFLCSCCRDSAGPLPALSEPEIQARETAHAIIVNFTRNINVVSN